MKKIALIAVNSGVYEKEEEFNEIFGKIVNETGNKMVSFFSYNIDEMVEEAKDADKVYILIESEMEVNSLLVEFGRKLKHNGIRPTVIITTEGDFVENVDNARNALPAIWRTEEPGIPEWRTDFRDIYFSYSMKAFSFVPDKFEKGNVEALVKELRY